MSGGLGSTDIGDSVGDFRILREIGEGGMGVVYLARDERLERQVALKVIAPHLARDEDFRKRFIAEARSAAAIEHPNVVTVYSAGTADGNLHIAMRYIKGTDLRTALRADGPLDVEPTLRIIADVGAALDAAHAAGMVHRDVKPGNVLLDGDPGRGTSYLTDFGLAKASESETHLTGTGQWVGTADYVAPEQIQGGTIGPRTDVYALGCVLYETLTGSVPFAGDEMRKMWGHVNEPFPALAERLPRHQAELDAVIERATAKDPADRFPSAGELARAATAASRGSRDQAKTVTGRAPRHPREQATAQMPVPPPRQRPPAPAAGSNSARTATIAGIAAVIAAGLVAAAILVAGGGSSEGTASASRDNDQGRATASGDLGDWPGGSGYTAMLGAFSTEPRARVWQRQAAARGLDAGVLHSSNFDSLRPGYWVVFSGSFASADDAAARAERAKSLGYSDSYPRFVVP